jgi:formylglycine-generating enzyme required for sulfatase activity
MNVSAATLTGQHASFYTLTLPANNVPITGGGITKATPTITKQPSNAEYTVNGTTTYYLRNTYTQALRNFSPSSAGVATGAGGAAVTGTWSWLAPDIVAGTYITRVGRQSTNTNTNLRMKFTPTGTYATNYNEVTFYPLLWLTVPASVIPVVSSGGTFNMTSVGSVTTVSFDINLYEVTNLLLSRVSTGSNVTAGRENYPATANWYRAIHFCNSLSLAQGYTPVYTINGSTNPDDWGIVPTNASQSAAIATWNAVIMDINANGYRLPTEAEWECMAKNKSNTPYTYAGSNNADEVAWHSGNSGGAVHEVGTKARIDRYGPYDMTGNLAEWCWDWYGNNPTMPAGPASGTNRVIRGGSYKEVARENTYRVGGKNPLTSSDTATEIGIRVLRTR